MIDLKFLSAFVVDGGLLSISIDTPANARYYSEPPNQLPADRDVFFGVAARKNKGDEKSDVLGSFALWVDADDLQKPLATLPPSIVVMSGHGYHLYWLLTQPLMDLSTIEALNQLLAKDVPTADSSCWNVNRVLRVPGSTNHKGEPVPVTLIRYSPELRYTVDEVRVLEKLSKAARHKIRTGDSRGYRSRSERDWAVITDLVAAGAPDALIHRLFTMQPVGEKAQTGAPAHYLDHTIEKARSSNVVAAKRAEDAPTGFEERGDGYYIGGRRGLRRVSTFVIRPKILLDGSTYGAEDAIVGAVAAEGFEWREVTFSRTAFTSVQKMDRETPVAAWQWLGSDNDVRQLLPHLLSKLQANGLPRVVASPHLGLHVRKDVPYFLGTDGTLSSQQYWEGFTGPLAWLPSQREHPETMLAPDVADDQLRYLAETLPLINEPDVVWLMLGWYAAATCKPWLEDQNYRYPVLNVVGTKGSGKTTLIQRVFMPLFGQINPKTYDANTTRFVILSILGSSNAVPVAFSEFRYESAEKFLRYVLLAYDTGHDPRGRGDQTTVDYPLLAPFSIDGEDLIADPAARERIVVAHLHPATIAEGGRAYRAFNELRERIPRNFGGYFVQQVLSRLEEGTLKQLLEEARKEVFKQFPNTLPDRVRNNHVVNLFGTWLWCDAVKCARVSAEYLHRSVQSVYSVHAGRSRTLVDDMVEDVVNASAASTGSFKWEWDSNAGVLYFQFAPAHSWWLASRRRQGRGGLERDALKAQLAEAPYTLPAQVVNGAWMMGIRLAEAQAVGLDVPNQINIRELKVRF